MENIDNRVPDFDLIKERLTKEVESKGRTVIYEVTVKVRMTEFAVVEEQGKWDAINVSDTGETIWGYTPSRPVIEKREMNETLFSRLTPDLNLIEVIKAANYLN